MQSQDQRSFKRIYFAEDENIEGLLKLPIKSGLIFKIVPLAPYASFSGRLFDLSEGGLGFAAQEAGLNLDILNCSLANRLKGRVDLPFIKNVTVQTKYIQQKNDSIILVGCEFSSLSWGHKSRINRILHSFYE